MKILIVTSNYPRWVGDSTTPFVHNFARELVSQGAQVRVVAPHFEGAKRKDNMDGVEIRRFRYWLPESGQTVCYQGGALGNLKKSWVNKVKLPFLVLSELFTVVYHAFTWKPNVINSHWLIPQSFTCSVASLLLMKKHVSTVHGGDVFALDSPLLRRFKSFSIKNSHLVTVNSSVTEEKVREISPNSKTPIARLPTGILPLPNIAEEDILSLRNSLQKHHSEKLILFVGRLSEEKGVGDLIRAAQLLHDKKHKIRLVIVGEGHDRKSFENLAEELAVELLVDFIGWVDSTKVYHFFKACDVFVGPSKKGADGWIEAQGLTFVEAMLSECPVIGSNSGGIPDAVQPGKTGRLVKPGDAEDIALAIQDCFQNTAETRLLVEQAKHFAINNYLVNQTSNRFLQLCEQQGIK